MIVLMHRFDYAKLKSKMKYRSRNHVQKYSYTVKLYRSKNSFYKHMLDQAKSA